MDSAQPERVAFRPSVRPRRPLRLRGIQEILLQPSADKGSPLCN